MSTAATLKRKTATARYMELVHRFPLRPLRSKADAVAATAILDRLFPGAEAGAAADRGEMDYVHVLARLLVDYEEAHELNTIAALAAADRVSGVELLMHLMENTRKNQADIAKILSVTVPAVSMIIRGERAITADHARALGKHFKLDPGAFIK